jgi:hypothetical protein
MKHLFFWPTLLCVVIILPLWVTDSWSEVWAAAGFEDSPANSDAASAGASKIRDGRLENRSRAEVEHFWGGTAGSLADDNGLHRIGGARCYMQPLPPTGLFDSNGDIALITDLSDYDNTGGAGVGDLANTATNSSTAGAEDDIGHGRCWIDTNGDDGFSNNDCTADGAPDVCCTAENVGTCDVDDNQLYTYIGVAGDGGVCDTGYACGWQKTLGAVNTETVVVITDPGVRVKAGGSNGNLLFNGDFDYDGCVSEDEVPTGWTDLDAGQTVFDYVQTNGLQGAGCQVEATDTDGGDGISQELTALKANTTYRVTAQVIEGAAADECILTTSGAATEITTEMISVDDTAFAQLDGFFITNATVLDTVVISLTSTLAGDVCTWDHIAVYRQEDVEVPEAGIVAIYDTWLETGALNSTCVGDEDPDDCCTGAGTGTCNVATGWADVGTLGITFVPPTEGWIIQVGATVAVACDSGCAGATSNEGFACRLEKGGSGINGTVQTRIGNLDIGGASDWTWQQHFSFLDVNPTAGASITYTVACKDEGVVSAETFIYNMTSRTDSTTDDSNLWMMAYPPH